MKNQINKLQEYINQGLNVELFYSINLLNERILFQGNLTAESKKHIEDLFAIEFQSTKYNWIEYRNDVVSFTLTF